MSPPGLEREMSPSPQFEAQQYRAAGKLENCVALITGGDSGIGRAVAYLFAREGADVAILYLPEEQNDAAETKQAIEALGRRVLLLAGDICDVDFCKQAVEWTHQEFGRIDILVNNAAYQKHRDGLEEISSDQIDRTFRTNAIAMFHICKTAVPYMPPGSAIINTGSIVGLEGSGSLLDYAATKGAIHAFTKSLAQNLLDRGIRVNCVAPGPVWTPLNPAERPDEETVNFGGKTPMGRPAQPEEIAPAYVFLASAADSSYLTGHVLPLTGGSPTAS
ncbi:short chain dehydrogenase [Blastopirellula marina DSM 3645]|uniref:Short chain dehydrogenase n=2 Tax=Blastopirellula marina TaxID=124 RepID=A3ZR41_9BACT|nr:short chain dehydrogenase [Blastopirellula marina DSM 3645]